MNPILPLEHFVPDGEPHVFSDGRLYLYGSYDISGRNDYCSDIYHVFSTDDPKLEKWTDHGVSLKTGDPDTCGACEPGTILYAPDCLEKDGRYFLYFPTSTGRELVAFSDSPAGPFSGAVDIEGVSGDGIDPAVFRDDDGKCYLFWGQFALRGAQLNDEMTGIVPSTLTTNILTEYEHGFHEGSSIRKFGGRYYLIYTDVTRGRATCLSYAVSDKPLGPYRRMGVLIDNSRCDRETWNDHGSIEYFKGNYYIFYHRSSQGTRYSRRACAELLHMESDGSFREAIQTTTGASGYVSAYREWEASRACIVSGDIRAMPCGKREILCGASGSPFRREYAVYRYMDLGAGGNAVFRITCRGEGRVILRTEGSDDLAVCPFSCENFESISCPVSLPGGIHSLFLLFEGKDISFETFAFEKTESCFSSVFELQC